MIKKLPSKMIKWPNGNETEEYFTNADKVAKKLNEVIEAVNRLEQPIKEKCPLHCGEQPPQLVGF